MFLACVDGTYCFYLFDSNLQDDKAFIIQSEAISIYRILDTISMRYCFVFHFISRLYLHVTFNVCVHFIDIIH